MKGDNKRFWQRYAKLYGPLMKISGKGFYRELCEGIARDFKGDERVLELACGTGQLTFLLCDKVRSFVATDFSENMVSEVRRLYGTTLSCDTQSGRGSSRLRGETTALTGSEDCSPAAAECHSDCTPKERPVLAHRGTTAVGHDSNFAQKKGPAVTDSGTAAAECHSDLVPKEGLSFEVQDATALTYPDNSFDVVIIANALHIMPDPERALQQIRRVLRQGGVLYAPTFAQREGKAFKPWISLISVFGFKTFNRWSASQLTAIVESQGFMVVGRSIMNSGISPLVRLKAIAR